MDDDGATARPADLVCDCGYHCQGATLDEQVQDGREHARNVHGIEVSADQVRGQR